MSGSPLIYIGLKGGLTIKMSVNKLSVDAHSSYSPILPSSIDRLTKAMNSMKNDLGQIIIEGFHDAIIDLNKEQREAINSLPDDTKEWEDKFGVKLLGNDLESIDDLNMKLYSEPTANVNSIQSGYNGPGMKSVVPAYAECKMDFRLVPNQNPAEIYEYIKKHLIKKGFSDIEIEPLHQIFPFRTDMNSDLLDLVKTSAFEIYNKKPLVTPNMAGSGPMYEFGATNVGGVPVEKMIEKNKLESIVQRTRDGGAEIVALLKTGSAFYAPSAAIVQMVEAILLDKKQILPCAVLLNGEYGFNDVYAGVPVKLGAEGIEEVIEVDLNTEEQNALSKSVDSVIELLEIMEENS